MEGLTEQERQERRVARAVKGAGFGGPAGGENVEWRGNYWHVADVRVDGNHVHLTLTNPVDAPYRPSTNDG